MEFEVLGPVRLRLRAESAVGLGPMQRRLLAVLLVGANRPVSADALADALWGASPDDRVDSNLRLHVHRLRRTLGDADRLVFESGSYRLTVLPEELDAQRFESLVDEAAQLVGQEPQRCAELVRKALGSWRGVAYEGLDVPLLVDEAQRLSDLRLAAIEQLYEAELACGRDAAVVGELTDLVRRYPLRERLAASLMTALYRAGRQAEALRVYHDARRRLVDELGLEPGPELRAVERQILAGEPIDVGTPEPPRVVAAQLPVNVRGFVGRDDALTELDQLLTEGAEDTEDAVRIATLAGSAGVGKTALAVRWAHRVRDRFPDGQLYVDLRGFGPDEPLPSAEVLAGFLRALGVDGAAVPRDQDERSARFRSLLDGRRILVVLDNARTADQVRPLLPGSGSCFVLLTSRDALTGLGAREGAHRIDLERLSVDEARHLLENLLGDRVRDESGAVDELIERCARLPLALRIAADLVRSRPERGIAGLVEELADDRDRLDLLDVDQDPHSAVRAVFSWSYQRLSQQTARLFRMCGLHRGRDVDAYALAAMANAEVRQIRRGLDTLVRAHLVDELPGGRFRLHDLLRAYAKELAESLDTDDERRDAVARLSAYYLYTTSQAMDALVPQESRRRPVVEPVAADTPSIDGYDDARRWLDGERANLLALVSDEAGDYVSRLSGQLTMYLSVGGHLDDALALHGQALAVARRRRDVVAEAGALRRLGGVHYYLDNHDESVRYYERALGLHRERGDRGGEAAVLNNLGMVHRRCGRYREALDHYERAKPLYREVRRQSLSEILSNAGAVYWQLGRYDEARAHLEEALQIAGSVGNRAGRGTILSNLAEVAVRTGQLEEALALAEQALEAAREAGVRYAEAQALTKLGDVSRRIGDHDNAAAYYDQALDGARAALDNATVGLALVGRARVDIARGVVEQAIPRCQEAVEVARARGLRPVEAEALASLGDAYAGLGDVDRAREQWRKALEIYGDLGVPEADAVAGRLQEAAAP